MGKFVAVWSDVKKAGKSVTAYILANRIKEMAGGNLKIMVCCLNSKYGSLYRLFGVRISSTGLEDLINYQFCNVANRSILSDIVPCSNGIYFLGSYRTTNSYVNKNVENYRRLIECLKKDFDLIIFDTVSGNENLLTNMVLKKADMVVRLFEQDNESLKGLSDIAEKKHGDQQMLYVVSKYRDIYPRLSDIKRRYSLNKVYTMDYCEILQEMKNRDSMHLYIQRETACNHTIVEVSKNILEKLCFITEKETVKEMPRKSLRSLIGAIQRQ
jgi:cellulose biosynthesis protein BcsQ